MEKKRRVHLFGAGVFGLIFNVVFQLTCRAGWIVGAILGGGLFSVGGILMGLLPEVNGQKLDFYGAGFGSAGFLELAVLYTVYGMIVGRLYQAAEQRALLHLSQTESMGNSPLADSLGQNSSHFDEYKHRRAG